MRKNIPVPTPIGAPTTWVQRLALAEHALEKAVEKGKPEFLRDVRDFVTTDLRVAGCVLDAALNRLRALDPEGLRRVLHETETQHACDTSAGGKT